MEETDSVIHQQPLCNKIMSAGEFHLNHEVFTEVSDRQGCAAFESSLGTSKAALPLPSAPHITFANAHDEGSLPPSVVIDKDPNEEEFLGNELSQVDRDSLSHISSAQGIAEHVTETSTTPETTCLTEALYVENPDFGLPQASTGLGDEVPSDEILNVANISSGDADIDDNRMPQESSVTVTAALRSYQIEEAEHLSSVLTETSLPAEGVTKKLPVNHMQNADLEVQATGMLAPLSDTDSASLVTPALFSHQQEQQRALIAHSAESAKTLAATPSPAAIAAFPESGIAAASSGLQDGLPKAADEHLAEQAQTHAMPPEVSGLQEALNPALTAAAHETTRSEELMEPCHFLGSCTFPGSLETSAEVVAISCACPLNVEQLEAQNSVACDIVVLPATQVQQHGSNEMPCYVDETQPLAAASALLPLEAEERREASAAQHCQASPTIAVALHCPQDEEEEENGEKKKEEEEEEEKEEEKEVKVEEKDDEKEEQKKMEEEEKNEKEEEEKQKKMEEEEKKEKEEKGENVEAKEEKEEEKKDDKDKEDEKNEEKAKKEKEETAKKEEEKEKKKKKEEEENKEEEEEEDMEEETNEKKEKVFLTTETSQNILDGALDKPCTFADVAPSPELASQGLAIREIDSATPDGTDDRKKFDEPFQSPPTQIEVSETQPATGRQSSASNISCEEKLERSSEQKQDATFDAEGLGLTLRSSDLTKLVQNATERLTPSAAEVKVDSTFNVYDASEPLQEALQEFSASLATLSPSLAASGEKIPLRELSLPLTSSFPVAAASPRGQVRKESEPEAYASATPRNPSQSLLSPRAEVRLGAKPFTAGAGSLSATTFRRVTFTPCQGVMPSSPVSPVTPENSEDDVFLSGSSQTTEAEVSEIYRQTPASNASSLIGAPQKALPATTAPADDCDSKSQLKSAMQETSQVVTQITAQPPETGQPLDFQGAEDERQAIIKSLQVRKKVIKTWQVVADDPQQPDAAKRCVRRPSVTQLLQQTDSTPSAEDAANVASARAAAPPKVSLISPSRESSRGVVAAAAKTESIAGRFQRPVVGVTQNYLRKPSWGEVPHDTQPNGC